MAASTTHPRRPMVSANPGSDELSPVMQALAEDMLSAHLTGDIDVFLQNSHTHIHINDCTQLYVQMYRHIKSCLCNNMMNLVKIHTHTHTHNMGGTGRIATTLQASGSQRNSFKLVSNFHGVRDQHLLAVQSLSYSIPLYH